MSRYDTAEFYPMDKQTFEESVFAHRKRFRREPNTKVWSEGSVPRSVYARTMADASNKGGNGKEAWSEGGDRAKWWKEIVTGRRTVDYTIYGPGGTAGMWVFGLEGGR